MSKKCKTCGGLTHPPHLNKYCSPKCMNSGQVNEWEKERPGRPGKINQGGNLWGTMSPKSEKNRNTPAKFLNKTKELICERDKKKCIICGVNSGLQFHHVFFGTESIYGPERNNVDQGVTICGTDHLKGHSCSKGEGVRQKCIDYLNNLKKGK